MDAISEEWVCRSTSEQSRWEERNLPYGNLWWVLAQERACAARLLWFYTDGGFVYNEEFSILPGEAPAGGAE